MKNEYIVYAHINNVNGKIYVGITHHKNPNKRWKSGTGYKHCLTFKKAIDKYGWNNFKHIVLCHTTKERAILIEISLIRAYKLRGISYNIANGGEGSNSFSEDTINKLRSYTPWIKGKHHTEETVEKIREASKRPCSEDTRMKISKANKGKPYYGVSSEGKQRTIKALSKPVIKLSLTGEFISEYPSAVSAERFLNVRGNHISDCCNGKRKTAYGYKWIYK